MRKANDEARALIKHFEDCELTAYPDPKTGGDPWTIGWGHTGPEVHEGLVWTQEQADAAFDDDLVEREYMADKALPSEITDDQFSAFVSILYNVGPGDPGRRDGVITLKDGRRSSLLRAIHWGRMDEAADRFLQWVSPGSDVERGLRRRRVAERALFLGLDWRAALEAHIAAGG